MPVLSARTSQTTLRIKHNHPIIQIVSVRNEGPNEMPQYVNSVNTFFPNMPSLQECSIALVLHAGMFHRFFSLHSAGQQNSWTYRMVCVSFGVPRDKNDGATGIVMLLFFGRPRGARPSNQEADAIGDAPQFASAQTTPTHALEVN